MTTRQKYKIIEDEFVDILDKLRMYSANTGDSLEFDIDGYWRIYHEYDGKTIKRYKKLENAINYLLLHG